MASERLKRACERFVRQGRDEGRFAEFVRETDEDFTRLSGKLASRWKLPEHRGSMEDLRQEMLLGAFRAFRKYKPRAKGACVEKWAMRGMMMAAKDALHKMRGAKRTGDKGKNPNRIEVLFSAMGDDTTDDGGATSEGAVEVAMVAAEMFEEPGQEVGFWLDERRAEVEEQTVNFVEECAVEAVFEGAGLERATRILYDDADARLAYRLGCDEQARRLVNVAARALAERVEEMVA